MHDSLRATFRHDAGRFRLPQIRPVRCVRSDIPAGICDRTVASDGATTTGNAAHGVAARPRSNGSSRRSLPVADKATEFATRGELWRAVLGPWALRQRFF